MNRNVLTISALDPSGGTGIIADLKTLMACACTGMAVTTAIIAQNTQRVESVYPVPMEVIDSSNRLFPTSKSTRLRSAS